MLCGRFFVKIGFDWVCFIGSLSIVFLFQVVCFNMTYVHLRNLQIGFVLHNLVFSLWLIWLKWENWLICGFDFAHHKLMVDWLNV